MDFNGHRQQSGAPSACPGHDAVLRRSRRTWRGPPQAGHAPPHRCRGHPTRAGQQRSRAGDAAQCGAGSLSCPPSGQWPSRTGADLCRPATRAAQPNARPRDCRGRSRRYLRCVAVADPREAPDQTETEARPLRRRADRIDRPARVRMRRRKPCFLCRRRLFGWNVRLDIGQLRCCLVRLAAGRRAAARRRVTDAKGHRMTREPPQSTPQVPSRRRSPRSRHAVGRQVGPADSGGHRRVTAGRVKPDTPRVESATEETPRNALPAAALPP